MWGSHRSIYISFLGLNLYPLIPCKQFFLIMCLLILSVFVSDRDACVGLRNVPKGVIHSPILILFLMLSCCPGFLGRSIPNHVDLNRSNPASDMLFTPCLRMLCSFLRAGVQDSFIFVTALSRIVGSNIGLFSCMRSDIRVLDLSNVFELSVFDENIQNARLHA